MSGNGGSNMVEVLMEFASDSFDSLFVMDKDVRRRVCEKILEKGHLLTVTQQKFDIATIMNSLGSAVNVEEPKPVVHLNIGLSQKQRSVIQKANPDLDVRIQDSVTMPHGMAYATRIVSTDRLLSELNFDIKDLIDIGGNYLSYAARNFRFSVHCCTQKLGENGLPDLREYHRQEQRDVLIKSGKQFVDYCTAGTETCKYKSPNAISVHALPLINPELIPGIFKDHGLETWDAVFHYDVAMDTDATSGYMEAISMHWKVTGDNLHFHFDCDSSFPYDQKLSWTRAYARPCCFSADDWQYVVELRVRSLSLGSMKVRMTRMEKATVGYASPVPPLRWVGGDENTIVPVPIFDPGSGYRISDPRAYVVTEYSVPTALYEFVYLNCYANDTNRPDLPLSRDDVVGAIRTFNGRRKVNGLALTNKHRIGPKHISDVATGIYLAIVYKIGKNRVMVSHFTKHMQAMQARWGLGGVLHLIRRGTTLTASLPYLLLSKHLSEVVDVVAAHMRMTNYEGMFVGLPKPQVPYVELQPVLYDGHHHKDSAVIEHSEFLDMSPELRKEFYFSVREELPVDIRSALERELFDGEVPAAPLTLPSDDVQSVDGASDISDNIPEVVVPGYDTREKWIEAFRSLQRDAPEWSFDDKIEPEESAHDNVTRYARNSIFEYALYNLDMQYSTEKKALEFLDAHWKGGSVDTHALRADNQTKEIGAGFYRVQHGYVHDLPENVSYSMVIDPHTRKFHEVSYKQGAMYVGTTSIGVVYCLDMLRIANGKRLAAVALDALREPLDFSGVEFTLIDGIAGSGKTRRLTGNFERTHVFCTGPRDSAERVCDYLCSLEKFSNCQQEIKKRARTMDSSLLSGFRGADFLGIDEGLMLHCGTYFLAAAKTGARKVVVSGDSEQIPLIDRGSGYGKLCYAKLRFWDKVVELNETERLPADATRYIRPFYPLRRQPHIKTKSPVRRSMKFTFIPDPEDIRFKDPKPFETILSITQSGKAAVVSKPGFVDGKKAMECGITEESSIRPVYSSHEAQGATVPCVVAVRLNKFSNAIYDSAPHQYVTASRHTHKFEYRSVVNEGSDSFARGVSAAMAYTEEELDEVVAEINPVVAEQREQMAKRMAKFL